MSHSADRGLVLWDHRGRLELPMGWCNFKPCRLLGSKSAGVKRRGNMDGLVIRIGENAGKVWRILRQDGPLPASAIARRTRLKAAEADQATGWLAREGKLAIEGDARNMKIVLIE